MTMKRARIHGLLLFLVGSSVFVWLGTFLERITPVSMVDFKTVYCGARCLIEHRDPYNPDELEHIYITEAAGHPSDSFRIHGIITRYIYLPTAFVLTVPFALLPWGPAHVVWMISTGAGLHPRCIPHVESRINARAGCLWLAYLLLFADQ